MKKGHVRPSRRSEVTPASKRVVAELLETEVIEEVPRGKRYCSSMFVIRKGEDGIRPIFNYKELTDHMVVPKFRMASLFQVVEKLDWPANPYYTKIDIKQAFFCININKRSQFVTNFEHNNKFYNFPDYRSVLH